MVEYEDRGVNREAGGQPGDGGPWAIAGTVRPEAYWADPDGLHAGGWHRGVWDAPLYLSS